MEGEALPVQSGGHQCQQDGGGADQRHDADAAAMRQVDQVRAGIGDAGAARLGDDADILAGQQGSEQAFEFAGFGVLVERGEVQRLDRVLGFEGREELARGLGLFHDEVLQLARDVDDMLRQYLFGRCVAQRAGEQI